MHECSYRHAAAVKGIDGIGIAGSKLYLRQCISTTNTGTYYQKKREGRNPMRHYIIPMYTGAYTLTSNGKHFFPTNFVLIIYLKKISIISLLQSKKIYNYY